MAAGLGCSEMAATTYTGSGRSGRASPVGVGAEHAAVFELRRQRLTAAGALVGDQAGVDRHGLDRFSAAVRAGDPGHGPRCGADRADWKHSMREPVARGKPGTGPRAKPTGPGWARIPFSTPRSLPVAFWHSGLRGARRRSLGSASHPHRAGRGGRRHDDGAPWLGLVHGESPSGCRCSRAEAPVEQVATALPALYEEPR